MLSSKDVCAEFGVANKEEEEEEKELEEEEKEEKEEKEEEKEKFSMKDPNAKDFEMGSLGNIQGADDNDVKEEVF